MRSNSEKKIYRIMEVCGTHTMAIAGYGLRNFFPGTELISGPGCPVCVTPSNRLEQAINLSREKVIICSFGDMLRVPAISSTLEKEKTKGADIRIIYNAYEPVNIALKDPDKEIVFIGAGFETTVPTAAFMIKDAYEKGIKNLSLFSMFKTIFPALSELLCSEDLKIDGFLLPGNVAAITGKSSFEFLSEKFNIPGVISGFSKKDIVGSVNMLRDLIEKKDNKILNNYSSVVSDEGNIKALNIIDEVFDIEDDFWRGFGKIKKSGFRLKKKYIDHDAEKKFKIKAVAHQKDNCICGDIMKGLKTPVQCRSFSKNCSPEKPLGPCMVSPEGVCAAYYKYGGTNG